MFVAVMRVRIVRMFVRHGLVRMRMHVTLAILHLRRMSVLVVLIVDVTVLMLERDMGMSMAMALGEVQPHSTRHESTPRGKLPGHGLGQ